MLFFESWPEIVRVALSTLLVYPFIVLAVRLAGKRSTAQMNNFDWIVTVALGSMVGPAVLLEDVKLAEVFVAMSLLLIFQRLVTSAAKRWAPVSEAVAANPTLLYHDGAFDDAALRSARVTRDEVCSAARRAGFGDLAEVGAVVLEPGAEFSVLAKGHGLALLESVERVST